MSKRHHGWCLFSPKGVPVAWTFAVSRDECWTHAYEHLRQGAPGASVQLTEEMEQLWKQWKESQDCAKQYGWTLRKVWFTQEPT